jgi:hypothetical protein
MKPRYPESWEQKAMRIARTASQMAERVDGALESTGKASLAPPNVLEARIAERLAASAPHIAPEAIAALAATKARNGHAMAQKLASGDIKPDDLTEDALANLESVIRVSDRPAWYVESDEPDTTSGEVSGLWIALATAAEDKMRSACRAVGCVMLQQDDKRIPIGTGWLIAKRTLVTNAHVASHLTRRKADAPTDDPRGGYRLRPDVAGVVDFAFEHATKTGQQAGIEQVLYVEQSEAPDIAIFRLVDVPEVLGSRAAIEMDLVASRPAWANTNVFTVGHPVVDRQNDPNVASVFGPLDGTKRLSPGRLLGVLGTDVLTHDCSTTNGSSGSPLIDFASYQAVGLHYFGQPGERNEAVFLPALKEYAAIIKSQSGNWGI